MALDPFKLGDEVLLACIFGGVVMGVGVGMIMKNSCIKRRNRRIVEHPPQVDSPPVGTVADDGRFMYRDFGFLMFQDWKVPMYSWLSIFLMGKTIDMILQGFNAEKSFFIISDKIEEIRAYILNDLHRGGSIVPIQGCITVRRRR